MTSKTDTMNIHIGVHSACIHIIGDQFFVGPSMTEIVKKKIDTYVHVEANIQIFNKSLHGKV